MASTPPTGPAELHDEPAPDEPGLRWFKGWAQGTPLLRAVFAVPPGITIDGEIREVRLRRLESEDAYMLQFGVAPPSPDRTDA